MDAERQKIFSILRPVLLSAKGGVNIENLNSDYRTIVGENIPFKKFGFKALEAFLQSFPRVKISCRNNQYYVEAIPSEDSVHITRLIALQKKASNKTQRKINYQQRLPPSRIPNVSNNMSWFRMNSNGSKPSPNSYQSNRRQYIPTSSLQAAPLPLMTIHVERPAPVLNKTAVSTTPSLSNPMTKPLQRVQEQQDAVIINQYSSKSMLNPHNNNNNSSMKIEQKAMTNQILHDVQNNKQQPTTRKYPDLSSRLCPGNSTTHAIQPAPSATSFQVPSTSREPALPLSTNLPLKSVPKSSSLENLEQELESRVRILDLPHPVYKICMTKSCAYAKVKIGQHEMRTSAATERMARKLVVQEALTKLAEVIKPDLPVTVNVDVIKERLKTIICNRPAGVFEDLLPSLYTELYKEKLPDNWLSIIKQCPTVTLESTSCKSVFVRVSPVLEQETNIPSLKKEKMYFSPMGPKCVPPMLEVPQEPAWLIHVTSTLSTTEIWVRFVGDEYSVKYDALTEQMAEFYKLNRQPIEVASVGEYYAVFHNDLWHRVQCGNMDSNSKQAEVVFIDTAFEELFNFNELYALDKKFCTLPAQAMRLGLAGLEEFSECDGLESYLSTMLLDETLFVVPQETRVDFSSVIFYDTHGEDDIILNDEILKLILRDAHPSTIMTKDHSVHEAHISHVERFGYVYVQIQSEYLKYLTVLMNRLIPTLTKEKLQKNALSSLQQSKIYLCFYEDTWYRGKVVDVCLTSRFKVRLIDFGKIAIVQQNNMYHLEKFSEIIAKYPPQAVSIQLPNIGKSIMDDKIVAKLLEIAPPNESLLLKVLAGTTVPPVVELYKRTESVMASISGILLLVGNNVRSVNGDGINDNTKLKRRDIKIEPRICLKPPQIPDVGYYDVHVWMAVNPSYFIVQPYSDKVAFEEMKKRLQKVCNSYTGPCINPDSVKEGNLYAGKDIDGRWYRTYVRKMNDPHDIVVYFCDYGNFASLSIDRMQLLGAEFLELPYQAIKAKLAGVRPIEVGWTFENCNRFKEMVENRNFVSRIESLDPDELSPVNMMLKLKLIDVETSQDIYIDELLIEEKHALRAND